ncbi:MAG: alpha/beta hydrolase [Pseudomonadota bacterium]
MSEAIVVSSQEPRSLMSDAPVGGYVPGEHRLMVSGPVGQIEVALSVPSGAVSGFAIVCHPHPLMGGTMDNKVVTTLARVCRDAGLMAIRFNFRGVAASAGSFDQGIGEQSDVLALAQWAQTQFALPWRVLAGFSFGAYVSAQVQLGLSADAATASKPQLWLVAPPVTRFALSAQTLPAGTRVIYGDADEVVDPTAIADWLRAASDDVQITVVPDAGHFFHGQLSVLKAWAQSACRETEDAR